MNKIKNFNIGELILICLILCTLLFVCLFSYTKLKEHDTNKEICIYINEQICKKKITNQQELSDSLGKLMNVYPIYSESFSYNKNNTITVNMNIAINRDDEFLDHLLSSNCEDTFIIKK